jgi:cobalt-zinc-cadmium efflux system outer membrane protein
MTPRTRTKARLLRASVAAAMAACSLGTQAQEATANTAPPRHGPVSAASDTNPLSLRQAFDAAWARQPEAMGLQARRDAARAQQTCGQGVDAGAGGSGTVEQDRRLGSNQGAREFEVGVAVPLWLPGERSSSAALADAEGAATESRATAAQLRVAATVREAWWQWQRARIEVGTARDQLDNARLIAADVARRTRPAIWRAPTSTRPTAPWPARRPAWPRPRPGLRRPDSICVRWPASHPPRPGRP